MTNNIYTLKKLAKYLDTNVAGGKIVQAFSQEKGKLDIIVTGDDDTFAIEFSTSKKLPYLVLRDDIKKSSRNVAVLFEELYGNVVNSISVFEDQRAISFVIDESKMIVFTFFGVPNCYIISDDIVGNAFKDSSKYTGMNIKDVFGTKPSISTNETSNDPEIIIRKNLPELGPLYRTELLFRLRSEVDFSKENGFITRMTDVAEMLIAEIQQDHNFLYETASGHLMSLIRLSHLEGADHKEFDDINELLRRYISSVIKSSRRSELVKSKLAALGKRLKEEQRKNAGIREQLEQCRNSTYFQKCGELIIANIGNISSGQTLLIAQTETGEKTEIRLKPELTPARNAAAFFDKSKRQKASIKLLNEKITRSDRIISELMKEIETVTSSPDIKLLEKQNKKQKSMENDETNKFRKFVVSENFEVWVGKDSASNDLLTKKYSAQNDLWFHVRGASGSHTVLKVPGKKAQIPKSAIESAASIAAYYSKARNAGSVPVAYCERKYVKKKKGFKEGTVVMEREKVVFVRPALPEE